MCILHDESSLKSAGKAKTCLKVLPAPPTTATAVTAAKQEHLNQHLQLSSFNQTSISISQWRSDTHVDPCFDALMSL